MGSRADGLVLLPQFRDAAGGDLVPTQALRWQVGHVAKLLEIQIGDASTARRQAHVQPEPHGGLAHPSGAADQDRSGRTRRNRV